MSDPSDDAHNVWKNRVMVEQDGHLAERIQEQEIIENREFVSVNREAEIAGLKIAQQMHKQEMQELERLRNLQLQDEELAQRLLREEALAIQKAKDEQARKDADLMRRIATEEYRQAQLKGAAAPRTGSSSNLSGIPGPASAAAGSASPPPLNRAQSVPASAMAAQVQPITNSPPITRGDSALASRSDNDVRRQNSDPVASYTAPPPAFSPSASSSSSRPVPTPTSVRYMLHIDEKKGKCIVVKNQKFQDSYIVDLKNWDSKSHAILMEADKKVQVLEIRLVKDSKPKTYHFLLGGALAAEIKRQPKKGTPLELVLGPGKKWVISGDFASLVLSFVGSDGIPVGKMLGRTPGPDSKTSACVLEMFNDIMYAPVSLALATLLAIAPMHKD